MTECIVISTGECFTKFIKDEKQMKGVFVCGFVVRENFIVVVAVEDRGGGMRRWSPRRRG